MTQQSTYVTSVEATVTEHRTVFVTLGILLAVLGIVAITFPFMTTITAKLFLGWIFLIGGIGMYVS